MKTTAILVLEDGTVMRGLSCGAPGEASGEMVFNTSMTGYQEILTDPSYKGQLVLMTYPLIGNYGITKDDNESKRTGLEGFIVRELCRYPSNFESVETAGRFLKTHGVPAIEGIDTRALTRRLREKGALRCILSTTDLEPKSLLQRVKKVPSTKGRDLAGTVSCEHSYGWDEPLRERSPGWPLEFARTPHVVVMDFGAKYSILRCLVSLGCRVTVVPAKTPAKDIAAMAPDGIMLSNGPGDPEPVEYAIDAIRELLTTRVPLFGICLGHQLLSLALGGKTYKMKFGHHGANHPVQDLATQSIAITVQNHSYCVDLKSLPKDIKTTHVNLNDKTSEGLAHSRLPVFSVQHHPEAAAGPHDARTLFTRFGEMIRENMKAPKHA